MSSKFTKNFIPNRSNFVWTLSNIHPEWGKTSIEIFFNSYTDLIQILVLFMLIFSPEIHAKNLKFEEFHQETVESHRE